MGEIKSTWDIVMEKTRDAKITPGDREKIKDEERTSRINTVFHRYMDGGEGREYLQKELRKLEGVEREIFQRELLTRFLASLDLSTDNRKAIAGIGILKGKSIGKAMEKLHQLILAFTTSRDERAREFEGILLKRLAARGISGSAVQPRLEGQKEWIDAMKGLQGEYGNRLEALKIGLLKS
jgi:hypothetical protein